MEIDAEKYHEQAAEQHQITGRPPCQITDYQKDGAGKNQRQS